MQKMPWKTWLKGRIWEVVSLGLLLVLALLPIVFVWRLVWWLLLTGIVVSAVRILLLLYRKFCSWLKPGKYAGRALMTNWQMILSVPMQVLEMGFAAILIMIVAARIGQVSLPKNEQRSPSENPIDGWVDYRGQIHVHSQLSHDCDWPFSEIAKAAKSAGVRWIILTDHISELPPGTYPDKIDDVLFIYGNERPWKEDSSRFLASLKDAKPGLSLYGHIEQFGTSGSPEWDSWDAIELVNFHANALENPWRFLQYGFCYPKDFYQSLTHLLPKNLEYWQRLAEREQRPVPIFAGPDAHQNIKPLGIQVDPYELILRLVSTHIWLDAKAELNQASIFDAVKKGHSYVAFDYLGDPTGFQFWAEDINEQKLLTGSTVKDAAFFHIAIPTVIGSEIRVYRNNKLFDVKSDEDHVHINPAPGFWRVEVWRNGYPWIISGQILMK